MRRFLPIKGPGGRYLTPNEKIALLALGLTLVLCVLTLTAGERVFTDGPSRNPVFAVVAWLGRSIGGGIIALYGLVLAWSGLIFFKGERLVRIGPLPGRLFAALGVTVGVSGALGLGHLQSAGALGDAVGGALGHTLGDAVGFPLLLGLMMLGFHLAGQGIWSAIRVHSVAVAGGAGLKAGGFGFETGSGRFGTQPAMPDDGDPTADERSLAVTRAMEEIERSQGVTIVDVEETARPSIGEEVEAAGAPAPDTEEDEVRRGLDDVHRTLGTTYAEEELADRDGSEDENETAEAAAAVEQDLEQDTEEDVEEDEFLDPPAVRAEEDPGAYARARYAEEDEDDDDDPAAEAYEAEDEAYVVEEITEEDEEPLATYEEAGEDEDEVRASDSADDRQEEDEDDNEGFVAQGEDEYASASHGLVPVPPQETQAPEDEAGAVEDDWEDEPVDEAPPVSPRTPRYLWDEEEAAESPTAGDPEPPVLEEVAVAEDEADPAEESEPQADGFAEDPYAKGGLVRRLQRQGGGTEDGAEDDRPYTSFDWRGHPLD